MWNPTSIPVTRARISRTYRTVRLSLARSNAWRPNLAGSSSAVVENLPASPPRRDRDLERSVQVVNFGQQLERGSFRSYGRDLKPRLTSDHVIILVQRIAKSGAEKCRKWLHNRRHCRRFPFLSISILTLDIVRSTLLQVETSIGIRCLPTNDARWLQRSIDLHVPSMEAAMFESTSARLSEQTPTTMY